MPSNDAGPDLRVKSAAGRWVLAATVLGSGMASIDATVVGIALPTIGRQFHSPLAPIQWAVTGYTLALAALLLVGGALGDRYGRRRIFMIGVSWFALTSAACAIAANPTELVITRLLQGAGAALLVPGSLAILQSTFAPDDRGRAIGAWSGLGGLATALGPLLGGYLITAASWRWIFLINLPIAAAVLAISARHLPETHDPEATGRIDWLGAALATVSLAAITYALIEGPAHGISDPIVALAAIIGIVGAVSFVVVERRTAHPMMPVGIFKQHQFTVTNAVTFVVYAALGGALFLLPIELQVVDHYSPLESGASLLPLTALMLVLSARSGRLAGRIGPRLQMGVGPLVIGVGLALLARTTTDATYVTGALPAVVVFGFGLVITVAPLTITALGSVPAEHAGLASAINNDVARAGGLIAVAILPALAGLGGASYLNAHHLVVGFPTAMWVAAGACGLGGVVAAIGIRNRLPTEPEHEAPWHCSLDAPAPATPLARATEPNST